MGAPNASVRILVTMSILKEGFGCSDEDLFEKCEFDLLTRRALGLVQSLLYRQNQLLKQIEPIKTIWNYFQIILDVFSERGLPIILSIYESHNLRKFLVISKCVTF